MKLDLDGIIVKLIRKPNNNWITTECLLFPQIDELKKVTKDTAIENWVLFQKIISHYRPLIKIKHRYVHKEKKFYKLICFEIKEFPLIVIYAIENPDEEYRQYYIRQDWFNLLKEEATCKPIG